MSRYIDSPRRAFTLIEILVVISIVALLLALLMPALSVARKHAHRAKCAANLRSMGQALTMYTQEYGYYPGCIGWGHRGSPAIWPVRLRLYMRGNTTAFHCPAREAHFAWEPNVLPPLIRPIPPNGVMHRWALDEHLHYGYAPGERLIAPGNEGFSYGYNGRGTRFITTYIGRYPHYLGVPAGLGIMIGTTNNNDHVPELRANRVRVPSEMIAIADARGDGDLDVLLHPGPEGLDGVGNVHSGGANVLFCDGHVKWYLQRDLHNHDINDPRTHHIRRLWNHDNLP